MKNGTITILIPLSLLLFSSQASAEGGGMIITDSTSLATGMYVTAFGAQDRSQCEDVAQTGGMRPESCPSEEDAQGLSFMAFNAQDLPLRGYGIGDSILNEEGECANLDAKYSTYYEGLEFWDHAWVTQEDAARLGIEVGSILTLQEGACPEGVYVTAFGAQDQSQCEDVAQTGGMRPESCPSEEDAQGLSFMAFNDQDLPLRGYGIGDSILNEEGECANLDAKYSTYYEGLEFWDHAWVTQEDAARLGIEQGSRVVLQEGVCEVPEVLDSLSAISRRGDRIRVRVWPYEGVTLRLCVEHEDGSEHCKEKAPRDLGALRGGGLTIRKGEGATAFHLSAQNEAGEVSSYGPFNIPEENVWEDIFACESGMQLEHVESRYRENWGSFGRWILRFELSEDIRIRSYGLRKNGSFKVKNPGREAGSVVRYGFGVYEGQESIDLVLRDRKGCIAEQSFQMPTQSQWKPAHEE